MSGANSSRKMSPGGEMSSKSGATSSTGKSSVIASRPSYSGTKQVSIPEKVRPNRYSPNFMTVREQPVFEPSSRSNDRFARLQPANEHPRRVTKRTRWNSEEDGNTPFQSQTMQPSMLYQSRNGYPSSSLTSDMEPMPYKRIRIAPPRDEDGPLEQMEPRLEFSVQQEAGLRPIIIDGNNVAYARSGGQFFDSLGIKICVDYFLEKGFKDVVVIVPEHRLTKRGSSEDAKILRDLQKSNLLTTSWSRTLPDGSSATSYDDRMIVEIADKRGGIIVSNDRYKDLYEEKQHWRETILKRVLPFRFMHGQPNEIMFPEDPLGRNGPNLEKFLRF